MAQRKFWRTAKKVQPKVELKPLYEVNVLSPFRHWMQTLPAGTYSVVQEKLVAGGLYLRLQPNSLVGLEDKGSAIIWVNANTTDHAPVSAPDNLTKTRVYTKLSS
jgi:hypothetical protein